MKFKKAFELMKQGSKIKLPSWGGYWFWDNEKQTIIMHTIDNIEMDIRETDRVEYTTLNIANDEWIIADEVNCPELGGESTFDFGTAIKFMKRGLNVYRKGWNGKDQFVFLIKGSELQNGLKYGYGEYVGEPTIVDTLAIKTSSNQIQIGWLATQTDMLAKDWTFAEQEEN